MSLEYNEACRLDDALSVALEDWERSRDDYWGEGVEDGMVSYGQIADDLAGAVLEGVTGLVRPVEVEGLAGSFATHGFSRLAEALSIPELRRLGLERMEIGLARQHSIWPRSMAERALDLAPLVLEGEPSKGVRKYLPRMARAYVLGLDLEAVIIARSVLESAVRDWYRSRSYEPPETMKPRLEFLRTCRVLSAEEFREAWAIWLRGNRAVHEGEAPSEGAAATLKTTLKLVSAIEGIH